MGVFDWLRRRADGGRERAWRAEWRRAIETCDEAALERLRTSLQQIPRTADDLDIEYEMLDGLVQLAELRHQLAAGQIPLVETGHRVVGSDACHFSAPVSLADDPGQPSGRLLLTSTRAVFVAGRLIAMPWHAARQVVHLDRDVLLVRVGTDEGVRFRCNTYADALRATEIARHLLRVRKVSKESTALSTARKEP